jgi:hypothetical protein
MTARTMARGMIDALFDVGHVVSTSLSDTARQVLAVIEGHGGGGSSGAERRTSVLWGHAAILMRPKAPTTSPSGRCEVVFVRSGNELVPVASRDLRWQIDLAEGDVVVRNLDGTHPVRLHLKADGTAILEADTVKIGDSGATNSIALGDVIKNHFNALKSTFDNHIHTATTTATVGAGPTVGVVTVAPPSSTFDATPDIESRHKVEN